MSNFFRIPLLFLLEYLVIIKKQFFSLFTHTTPEKWLTGSKGDIVLLPGFNENWFFLKRIGNSVNTLGFRVHVVNELGRNLLPIKNGSALVEEYIRKNKLQNVIFLSHSKGGIIAKLLLDSLAGENLVGSSLSIATPYGGTLAGYLSVFSLSELLPSSSIIKRVNETTKKNQLVTNIFTRYDNHIIPTINARLKGAKNIRVDVIGHTRILDAEATLSIIEKSLLCAF